MTARKQCTYNVPCAPFCLSFSPDATSCLVIFSSYSRPCLVSPTCLIPRTCLVPGLSPCPCLVPYATRDLLYLVLVRFSSPRLLLPFLHCPTLSCLALFSLLCPSWAYLYVATKVFPFCLASLDSNPVPQNLSGPVKPFVLLA